MPSNGGTSEAIRELRAERERLKGNPGRSGRDLVQALTAAMDAAVRAVWRETVAVEDRISLVALGGYGRGELCPHSDIDLMVLHAGRGIAPDVGKALFYELWDAGFKVGHAIRTIKGSLKLAVENLEAETSFLDARLLAGDEGMFEEFRGAALKQTRKRGSKFLDALREEAAARHGREGHASYLLEPNLKEGAGGLRDRSVVVWLSKVFEAGVTELAAVEAGAFDAASEVLFRARNQLHHHADRAADVLLLAYQDPVAQALGYRGNGRPAVDSFLRDLYAAARVVDFAASSALAELGGRTVRRRSRVDLSPGVALEDGRVRITDRVSPAADPSLAMRAFAEAAKAGAPVAAETLSWLRREADAGPDEYTWSSDTRRAFFELLACGERAADPLEAMDQAGLLSRFLPEWDGVRCQPQHNVYHRFTVDVHLLTTVAKACALAADGSDPLPRDVWRDVADKDRLLLACLLHDIGKGTDEDHSILGETLAGQICKRVGLSREASDEVVWLVRHHLLLPDTATRRDTDDENLVVETAESVGDAERLKRLYLLSVADGRATGPAAWNPWKATLVGELFTKVLHVLERGDVVGRDASDLLRLRTTQLREALTRYPDTAVEAHLHNMPRAYLLAFPVDELIRHFALMANELGPSEVRVHWTPGGAPGVYELIVVARDRPGLFSKASGALSLNGVNVLDAQIFTSRDGIAIEAFRVEGAHDREIDAERWERVEANLSRALAGRISLDLRLAEKRDAYDRPSKGKREPAKVIVDNSVSDFYTVVEVHATDRVGLLYGITRALADMELNIHAAKVATYAEDVVDVFYVHDVDGQKVTDREHMREIERTVLMRIGE